MSARHSIPVMGNWIQVHELNWIQFTKYESRWIEPNLFSSESDLSWIHWFCWESWVWIELDLVESCNDESELSLNPIYMNPKWIWIHYLPKRIQESTPFHDYNPILFEPRRSTWEFPTRHNEKICSRLVLYFYVHCTCITLTKVWHAIFSSLRSSINMYQKWILFFVELHWVESGVGYHRWVELWVEPILCCSPLLWIVSWIPYGISSEMSWIESNLHEFCWIQVNHESWKRSRCTSDRKSVV